MRLTKRDVALLRDLALSHVLSRDQIIALGYFGTVTRANTRLRLLASERLARRLETPFHAQGLYTATPRAAEVIGSRIAPLLESRTGSPRFLQHALSVTNARIALVARGASQWRFEQQASASFSHRGRLHEVRPDGLAIIPGKGILAVEIDLGHANPAKFGAKLASFDLFVRLGEAERLWGDASIRLLTLTPGKLRADRLHALTPPDASFVHVCQTFESFGVPVVGSWS